MAKISKSTWGENWRVEERIGSTLYYTNHDTMEDAVAYCIENNLSYTII